MSKSVDHILDLGFICQVGSALTLGKLPFETHCTATLLPFPILKRIKFFLFKKTHFGTYSIFGTIFFLLYGRFGILISYKKYRIMRIIPVTLAIARATDIIRQYPRSLIRFAHSSARSLSPHIASRFYYCIAFFKTRTLFLFNYVDITHEIEKFTTTNDVVITDNVYLF